MTDIAAQNSATYTGTWWRERVGFWRRVGAFFLDAAIVLIPLQLLVVVLYTQTDGRIQGSFGLIYRMCADLDRVPEGFPHTLERIDTVQDCQTTLFGLPMSRQLVLSQTDQTEGQQRTLTEELWLNADGYHVESLWLDANGAALAIFLLYLIAFEWRIGQTVGKHVLDIRVLDRDALDALGIPLTKAIFRQAVLFAPILAFLLLQYGATSRGAAVFLGGLFLVFASIWVISVTISLARKTDPLYDRLAGTIVVKI